MIIINTREGRTGSQESVFTLTVAMCLSGLFTFESYRAYAQGNSTYLSIPMACLLAFFVFSIAFLAMKKSKSSDFHDLAVTGFGKTLGTIVCVFLVLILLICTSRLINRFLNIMRSYFYQDAMYDSIAVYFLVVLVIFACMGLETITRTAKLVGIILILSQALLFFNSSSGYELYKIYPLAGDGAGHMLSFAFSSIIYFMPALLVALITAKGTHGTINTGKTVRKSVVITVIVCTITQLFLGLAFTYDDLSELYMPLYRMSMITGEENFLVRLDKLSAFVWMSGALIAGSYYLYGASLLYCRTFKQLDIRPAASSFGLITIVMCLLSHSGDHTAFDWLNFVEDYGVYLICVPIILLSFIAIIRNNIKVNKNEKSI